MAAIGNLVFCTDCGNLLPPSIGNPANVLHCDCCGTDNPDNGEPRVVSKTKPSDFPSPLRQKLSSVQTVERHQIETEAVDNSIQCEKCGERGAKWSAVQLRGADEGSTIFYTCIHCAHKWNTNN